MSIGTVFTAIGAIALFSFLYIGMGLMMDKLQDVNNAQISNDMSYSENKHDLVTAFLNIWSILPIVMLFLTLIWAYLNAVREKTGEI